MTTTRTPPARPAAPPIGAVGMARWAWRQLTSMRVALVLLFLLALAAVPGSIVPQRGSNPAGVFALREADRSRYEWYDRLGLLDVYSAPWFAAIYLLLFVSLVGCIVPRTRQHWHAMRARPPQAPRHLDRLPAYAVVEVAAAPVEVRDAARAVLRQRRYRVVDDPAGGLAAERGHWRETGNLLFHLSYVPAGPLVPALRSVWLVIHHRRRRDLGRRVVGPHLGLGPQGGLVADHLAGLCGVPARPHDRRMAGAAGVGGGADRVRHAAVQLLRGQHLVPRPALVRRPLLRSFRGRRVVVVAEAALAAA